jgi:hypothetical protein|tara:strand:+ start:603 stop:827 length:225 start_codon:yes stop_codon:yes gene_type:complete
MAIKPKLDIRSYNGDGKYDYALFRSDRATPICSGISREHAERIKIIVGAIDDTPESFPPIKDWSVYNTEFSTDV